FPGLVSNYTRDKHEVLVEAGAGTASTFSDEAFTAAGAQIVSDVYSNSDLILKVLPARKDEADKMKEGAAYIGFLSPFTNHDTIKSFVARKITSFSMELVPRITRAQSMDALSSMATVGGYKAVLLAADHLVKMFPLLMTAAGTIPPATVLVLGA